VIETLDPILLNKLRSICVKHKLNLATVRQKYGYNSRSRKVMKARLEVCNCLRDHGWSYPAIGKLFDRHHTTIMYLVKEWI
jgi:chromosomal replication initiation ATPase DnaA